MLPETAAMLGEFYRPFNADLARMLGDERYLQWTGSALPGAERGGAGAPMGAPGNATTHAGQATGRAVGLSSRSVTSW